MTSLIDDAMVEKAALALLSHDAGVTHRDFLNGITREIFHGYARAALTAVAEDIARKVREECAESCDAVANPYNITLSGDHRRGAECCASRIRSLNKE